MQLKLAELAVLQKKIFKEQGPGKIGPVADQIKIMKYGILLHKQLFQTMNIQHARFANLNTKVEYLL